MNENVTPDETDETPTEVNSRRKRLIAGAAILAGTVIGVVLLAKFAGGEDSIVDTEN